MPDTGFLILSVLSLVVGALLILFPSALSKIGQALNRTLITLDERLIRYRYVAAIVAFIGSYAFFKLALLLPQLGRQ